MGLATQSYQLSFTTLCEHLCWQEPKLQKTCSHTPFNKHLLHIAASPRAPLPSHLGRHSFIFAETRVEPHAPPHSPFKCRKDGPYFASQDVPNELNGHDQFCSSNAPNAVHNEHDGHDVRITSSPSAAATCADGVQIEESEPYACDNGVQSGPYANSTSQLPSDDVQHKCTSMNPSNVATDINEAMPGALDVLPSTKPSKEANLYSDDVHEDPKGPDVYTAGALQGVNTSKNPSNTGEEEAKGKIRRFSLNEPGLLKTLQESRALTPLEQENLELLMKFKLTKETVKGQLVIRAVRTEQLRDLENLLTDSYSELMWGPLTYRPVLTWILSTYLRERQAYLPHAVTLVGLYAPSDESNDVEAFRKWWLAGAVEISFNAIGKPKDMQTPMPPEDAPFLSNMAVLKRFRRRGIGRELLKAAEQLVFQMGGNEIYLHCRMIDEAPLNMYKNAGYAVVETDSILSLLLFRQRRHLMYKTLAVPLHQGIMVPVD